MEIPENSKGDGGVCTATPCGLAFSVDAPAQTERGHELQDMAQRGRTHSVGQCTTAIGQKHPGQRSLYHTCQTFSTALHRYRILQQSKYRDTGRNSIQKCSDKAVFFLWNTIFQSRRSTRSPLALSSVAAYMPISRDLRQQMLSDPLSNMMSLTLSVWPLAHNVDWTPEASRPCAGRPGLWASILSEHACVYMRAVYLCASLGVYLSECNVIARLIIQHSPPEVRQNSARWRRVRRAFPPSQASTRDHVSFALCKQETCARSALSAATVMRVTLSCLHTRHGGHLNHAGREEREK